MAFVRHYNFNPMFLTSLAAVQWACGSGGVDLDASCRDSCAHSLSCGWIADEAACLGACPGDTDLLRADALEEFYPCLAEMPCTADNPQEACFIQVVDQLDALSPHDAYASRCAELAVACSAERPLPANVCEIEQVLFFTEQYMTTEVVPCLDLACADAAACLELQVLDVI